VQDLPGLQTASVPPVIDHNKKSGDWAPEVPGVCSRYARPFEY